MATGRSNKIVGQTGEYLVAAELSRRGLIATTFTGNVPHYDIIASDEAGNHVSVQVKTSRTASWQFNIKHFCKITFDGKRQVVGKRIDCPVQRLIVTCVTIADTGHDQFYILSWDDLRDLLVEHHKTFLSTHGGVRPRRWDSFHCQLKETSLAQHKDKWATIEEALR